VGVTGSAIGVTVVAADLEVVTGGDGTAEERLGKVRELLMSGGETAAQGNDRLTTDGADFTD
jgi:hypothetical protein